MCMIPRLEKLNNTGICMIPSIERLNTRQCIR